MRTPGSPSTLARRSHVKLSTRGARLAACLSLTTASIAHATHCVDYRTHLHMRKNTSIGGNDSWALAGGDGRAIMAGHGLTYLLDISNPEQPVNLSTLQGVNDVAVHGNRAWQLISSTGLRGYDVP